MSLPPLELLKSVHSFPGPYTFKIITQNTPAVQTAVVGEIQKALGLASPPTFSSRTSENGNHAALTVEITLQKAEDVHTVYEALHKVSGVLMLL